MSVEICTAVAEKGGWRLKVEGDDQLKKDAWDELGVAARRKRLGGTRHELQRRKVGRSGARVQMSRHVLVLSGIDKILAHKHIGWI